MLTKKHLLEIFSKDPKTYYEVEMFGREGFTRKKCPICQKNFWSISKESCGDASCESYGFFKEGHADYIEMWKEFERFFEKNGHTPIKRYPVIARWREDLHFTIASIVDFMRVEKGNMNFDYPANPLIVPQTCLRFPDISLVGKTGRHMTSFIMAGQHSFGSEGYWKDRCLDLNYEYFTTVLGIPKEELTYIEDVWAMPDLSSFGPCMESFSKGVELCNSVFMEYRKTGEDTFGGLDTRAVDVGWGFDRLVWYKAGTPTVYDVAFGPVVGTLVDKAGLNYNKDLFSEYSKLSSKLGDDGYHSDMGLAYTTTLLAKDLGISLPELEKEITPLQDIYVVADHVRTLLFAIADGGIPSNVGGGYNLRVILRRALSKIKKQDLPFSLIDVAEDHAKYLRPMFPELAESLTEFSDTMAVEEKRYNVTLEKSRKIVKEALVKSPSIPKEKYLMFYESHGVTPEIIKDVGEELGINVEIPEGIYEELTNRHSSAKVEKEKPIELPSLPKTIQLYYQNYSTEGSGKVLYVKNKMLVLDQTPFYPEGGGQAPDKGTITKDNGEESYEVVDVQTVGGVIIHYLTSEPDLREGDLVNCQVDKDRRMQLRQHHTATHIMAAAARAVLGNHVWQAGAKKEVDKAHLDITHYERITPEQLERIEQFANEVVAANVPVTVTEMTTGEAERKYGFQIYQGGAPTGKIVRVLSVGDYDVELCGGTHLSSSGQAGLIKIIKEERIQDGVNRLEYTAGKASLRYIAKQSRILSETARILSSSKDLLPKTAEKIFNEWKERDKTIDKLIDIYVDSVQQSENIEKMIPLSVDLLRKISLKITNKYPFAAVLLFNKENYVVCTTGKTSSNNAGEILKKLLEKYGGKGGGSKIIATGRTDRPMN